LCFLSEEDVYQGKMLMFTFGDLHEVGNLMLRMKELIERIAKQQSGFPQ